MCSIKVTLNTADGSQQTFVRSADKTRKEEGSGSDLAVLHKQMGEIQAEVNAALTVLVDKEKAAAAAGGKQQAKKITEDQEDDEDDDDDDDDDENIEENGSGEPPEKRKKAS